MFLSTAHDFRDEFQPVFMYDKGLYHTQEKAHHDGGIGKKYRNFIN